MCLWVRRPLARLRQAARHRGLFHLWFHPYNLTDNPRRAIAALERVCAEAARLRDEGRLEVVTMGQLADRLAVLGAAELSRPVRAQGGMFSTLPLTPEQMDELEAADVEEVACTYLYRQGDTFVFMNTKTYDQYELTAEQVDEYWKYLKEGMAVQTMLFNGQPISITPPPHVELKVEYCEPGARGDTATNVTKPCKLETGAEILTLEAELVRREGIECGFRKL